ncbi:single-stranded DNA-binding protein [Nocardia brasiliensis]|uniref:single-stranded DNA-binding protein n=1 Tax=Nocardia brasiliensis TaxID=37326 RepID=UPI0024579724|nr:single-stranded DNA-binding protein [Nocardia brasiliensis]
MALPKVTGIGRLIRDPEIKFLPSGVAVLDCAIAFNKAKKLEDGTWENTHNIIFNCKAWRDTAEQIAEAEFKKGDAVEVSISPYQRKWKTREGEERLSLDADIFEFHKAPAFGEESKLTGTPGAVSSDSLPSRSDSAQSMDSGWGAI